MLSKEDLDRLRSDLVGEWDVDGDVYLVEASPGGGLLARSEGGREVGAAWVISRGRQVVRRPGSATRGRPPGSR